MQHNKVVSGAAALSGVLFTYFWFCNGGMFVRILFLAQESRGCVGAVIRSRAHPLGLHGASSLFAEPSRSTAWGLSVLNMLNSTSGGQSCTGVLSAPPRPVLLLPYMGVGLFACVQCKAEAEPVLLSSVTQMALPGCGVELRGLIIPFSSSLSSALVPLHIGFLLADCRS